MTSLCRHLLPTAQEIVNWVTTADGCVHTAYTTQLDFAVGKFQFVQTRRDCRQLLRIPYTPRCAGGSCDLTTLTFYVYVYI